ncbi:Meckel syndrome type 1 protein [Lysobacter niabensis]|uniref:Meckel syndrome type 1 protein n=1 Tax=Agrilutibacter niabensis TaxID=380628 RepID=A0ABU1VL52_9GAMM|nr:RseA family anti-sigma factor [Lysobacter niabensis]MDR7098196.1 Meckel syndrome type 1 protein [Lysobacter niabensis]
MTTGSNSHSNSNHHPLHPRDDREALSALFDGELPGDAIRFALRRLDHDAGWREACGRWQLIGDALRGEATSVAPPDFASGVMRMLAAEGAVGVVTSPASAHAMEAASAAVSRRRWIGGGAALAASVAVAAVLVVGPFSRSPSPADDRQVATGVVSPPNQAPVTQSVQSGAVESGAVESKIAAVAKPPASATAVAVTDVPPPTPRRSIRSETARSTPPTTVAPLKSPSDARAAAVATTASETARPFHPPVDDIVTRPWPRAVLPADNTAGAVTVGFGTSTATPSLYPFEPRLPPDATAPETVAEPER